MIQHTVTFRFRDDVDTNAFSTRVDDLADIPGVQQFTVMRQVGRKNDFTDALSMYFTSESEYAAYDTHPVHTAFVADVWMSSVADFLELDYVVADRRPHARRRSGGPGAAGAGDPVSTTSSSGASNRSNEVRDMYAALLQGELSGEEALAASEQMLRILMDSMTNAVFWKDLDSCFVGCNQAFSDFAGFEQALLLGKSDRDMPWADDGEFSSDWDQAVMESGEPQFGILERLRRADGVVTWIETNKVPLRDLNGEIIGLLGTFKDVTDVHLAQEELQRTLDDLDARVQRRTAEIERANEALRREVDDRIRSQAEERQQRTYAETLRDTAAAMSQTFDLESVTEQALGGVERLVSNDLAAILLTSAEGTLELSRHLSGFGYIDHDIGDGADIPTLAKLTIVERLSDEQGPVIVNDPHRSLGPARCVLGARMRVADQLVGYLIVESATPGFFTADHAERLGAVADQAGAVLSNARLAQRSGSWRCRATRTAYASERRSRPVRPVT